MVLWLVIVVFVAVAVAAIPLLRFFAVAPCLNRWFVLKAFAGDHSEYRGLTATSNNVNVTSFVQVFYKFDLINNSKKEKKKRITEAQKNVGKKERKMACLWSQIRINHIFFGRLGNICAHGVYLFNIHTEREEGREREYFLSSFPHLNNLEQSRIQLISSSIHIHIQCHISDSNRGGF